MYTGTVDVVVCDGFVGNVVLKVSRGARRDDLRPPAAGGSPLADLGDRTPLAKGALTALKRKADYAEYGGAPLLGVRGACLVGHGRSSPKAIRNALRFAHAYATGGVIPHIEGKIAELRERRQSGEVENA